MMRYDLLSQLIDGGAVAVIRMADTQKLLRIVDAFREGGVTAIEITMTTPNALHVIEEAADAFADDDEVLIGVGSVLDGPTARLAIDAGAHFVVGPVLARDIIETSHRYDVPVMPGAFTPSEIHRAHELRADVVKVFPAKTVGMDFFSAVKAPMPHLKLMPTGGVSLTNAGDWLRAGACAVGVGSALLDEEAVEHEDYQTLTDNARALCQSIDEARG